eukprot:3940669-Rhodomonas_salina.3
MGTGAAVLLVLGWIATGSRFDATGTGATVLRDWGEADACDGTKKLLVHGLRCYEYKSYGAAGTRAKILLAMELRSYLDVEHSNLRFLRIWPQP